MAERLHVQIDRDTPVPLYHQLAQQLQAAITSGALAPGDPFENEVAMADRLGLSRPTVRRAIQQPFVHLAAETARGNVLNTRLRIAVLGSVQQVQAVQCRAAPFAV